MLSQVFSRLPGAMPCALHIAEMRRRMIDVEAAAAVVVVSDDEGDVTDGPEL